ncbi:MAG: hypothetical protein RLZZ490_1835, partial [Cyanobacteriota bacterium]
MADLRSRPPHRHRPRPRFSQSPKPTKPLGQRLLPWIIGGIIGVFLLSLIPNIWPGLIPALQDTAETTKPPDPETIPLWQSSFEGDFPGTEWPPAQSATFS